MSAASGEASATAQSKFAEMITSSVKYRSELKLYKEMQRCMKEAKRGERPAKTT